MFSIFFKKLFIFYYYINTIHDLYSKLDGKMQLKIK